MATSQTNPSIPLSSAWLGAPWHVNQVDTGNNFGVWAPDAVTFTGMTTGSTAVQILSSSVSQNIVQQTTSLQGTPWLWGTLEPGLLSGQTAWGQPFHIECPYQGDEHTLACFLDQPLRKLPWSAVALGTIVGTLLGAAAGFAARSPIVGAIAGLIAATTGSLATFARVTTYDKTQDGSTPTWVANDGRPPGGRGPHGPHPIKAVGA